MRQGKVLYWGVSEWAADQVVDACHTADRRNAYRPISNQPQYSILRRGIDSDLARKLVKTVKNSKIKVQAAIQGDKLRISGKKRDDLQATIRLLKETDVDLPLQYENFRD